MGELIHFGSYQDVIQADPHLSKNWVQPTSEQEQETVEESRKGRHVTNPKGAEHSRNKQNKSGNIYGKY